MLVDTHCHIHESDYPLDVDEVLENAKQASVGKMICVGTNQQSSKDAVDFALKNDGVFAAIGVHPHDSKGGWQAIKGLIGRDSGSFTSRVTLRGERPWRSASAETSQALEMNDPDSLSTPSSHFPIPNPQIVAIGEIGLDYYYDNSPRDVQKKVLQGQIEFAIDHNLPIIFHVRDSFDDFWPIFDSYEGIRGEIHSFTDNADNLQKALDRGLYIGINGISTFTKDEKQVELYKSIPLDRILLETDSPFLTPVPFRGKVNEPAFVSEVAKNLADLKGISLEEVSKQTTANAKKLFSI